MMNDLLNLWITRLPDNAPNLPIDARIATFANNARSNLLYVANSCAVARRTVLDSMLARAHADSAGLDKRAWLAIDVPVPNRVSPTVIIHRMIRRLYFAAVLHGLAELEPFRDAVQSLRLSYLQTRGSVTTSSTDETTKKVGGEIGASLDITNPLSAKMTAEAEVKVAQELSAEMVRLDLYEAEDQLAYDLQLLAQLELFISRYNQHTRQLLPRWEQIKNIFRLLYSRIDRGQPLALRPLFVLEARSAGAVVSLMTFLSDAASLASAQGAQLILIGGPDLTAAWQADRALGSGIFREQFVSAAADVVDLSKTQRTLFKALSEGELAPEVKAVTAYVANAS
jgi:hypothetical protein